MNLQVIAVSHDAGLVACLKQAVTNADLDLKFADDSEALDAVDSRKIDVLIIDFACSGGPQRLIDRVRASELNSGCVIFAVVANPDEGAHALDHGANMMMPRPVSANSVRLCLRATYGRMIRERRRSFRQALGVKGSAEIGGRRCDVLIADVSESGVAIQSPVAVSPGDSISIRFHISEIRLNVECTATAVWSNADRRVGLKITEIEPVVGQRLRDWLIDAFEKQLDAFGPAIPARL